MVSFVQDSVHICYTVPRVTIIDRFEHSIPIPVKNFNSIGVVFNAFNFKEIVEAVIVGRKFIVDP